MYNKLIPVEVFSPPFTNYGFIPVRSCFYSSVCQSVSQSVYLSGCCLSVFHLPTHVFIRPFIHSSHWLSPCAFLPFGLSIVLCAHVFRSDLEFTIYLSHWLLFEQSFVCEIMKGKVSLITLM